MNVDALQAKLKKKLEEEPEEDDDGEFVIPTFENVSTGEQEEITIAIEETPAEVEHPSKKYVIYVDYENIEFMENLSISERRDVINKILKEQNEAIRKEKLAKQRAKYVKHLIVACVTFIICFPLLFIAVNKALVLTINNYVQARENYTKLYKEQGKIKPISPDNSNSANN
jgi:hypothetical protein